MARTPSRVEYHAHLDEPVKTKQAKTLRKLIEAHRMKHDRGHGDPGYDVLIVNIETQDATSVFINAGWAYDRIDEELAKGKAEVDR